MRWLGLGVAVLTIAAMALATHTAAAEEPASVPAVCYTIETAKPFAPLAQTWMREQQKRGATGFIASGNTVCGF